jgi:iron(III) transport system substrate-binding protein
MFEDKTGIKVNVVNAKANELIKRLEKEGTNSPADLLITADVGRLYLAQQKGLLQSVDSKFLNDTIPENLRDKDNNWFGLTKRARVIVYNKEKVKPEELSTYEDLTTSKWHKKVLIRQSSNIYNQSLLASFIASQGEEKAKNWAEGIVNNMARTPAGSDRDQMKAVVAGVGDVAIVNTYYVGKLLNSKKKNEVFVGKKMGVFFPNQADRGTHVNISGIAITKSSKNRENAVKLMEFLVSENAQSIFAEANYEYPVNPAVKPSKLLQSWGEFKEDETPLYKFGKYNATAVKIFNEVNWK